MQSVLDSGCMNDHAFFVKIDIGYVFRATITERDDHHLTGFIEQAVGFDSDDPMSSTYEPYIHKFYLKWDHCFHLNFGAQDDGGYLHFCGNHSIQQHCQLMTELFEWASNEIPRWMD